MPSTTTADKRDSIPAKNAIVSDSGIKLCHLSKEIEKVGKLRGISPNRMSK